MTVRTAARDARVRLQALTTSTLHVTGKAYIRVDAEYREESGSGTTDGSGVLAVTLDQAYSSLVNVSVTFSGTGGPRAYRIVDWTPGDPATFDILVLDATDGSAVSGETINWQFRGL